jgi:hypothetical protein
MQKGIDLMPLVESAQKREANFLVIAARRARAGLREPAPLVFFFTAGVILFTYFDVYHHFWFLKLIDGHVVKAWLPPALLLLVSLWQIRRDISLPRRLAGLKYPTLFLGAYILFGSISLAWNEDQYHAVKYGLIMFGPIMIYLASLLLLDSNAKIERILHALFWTGVLLSAHVFYMYEIRGYQSWVGEPYVLKWMWNQQVAQEALGLNYYDAEGYFDISRTLKLIDEPAFAAMLAPLVLFGFFQAARAGSWQGWLFFIPSVFLLYTLLGTAARSSFIAFIGSLVPFLWFIRRKRLHVLLILLATVVLLYLQPFMLYRTALLAGAALSRAVELTGNQPTSPIVRSIEVSMKKLDTAVKKQMPIQKDGHIESVPETLERTKANPLLGYGIGGLLAEHGTKETSWNMEHNRYLFILSTSGILTAIPYGLFVLSLLWLAWRMFPARRGFREEDFHLGVLLFPALVLFALQINNCGQERYYYWVFFGLAAAWIRNTTLTESHENPSP